MGKKFAEYAKFDLSQVNKEVLKVWDDADIFHKSIAQHEGDPSYVCQWLTGYTPRACTYH